MATELWLSQAEKSGCVPGDKQQPLSHCWPSHALEAFPSVLGEQSCRPSQGKSQQLLPSKDCFPALLVAVLPQCWWGDLSEWFFQSAPAKAVCAVPAASHPVVLPVASHLPN